MSDYIKLKWVNCSGQYEEVALRQTFLQHYLPHYFETELLFLDRITYIIRASWRYIRGELPKPLDILVARYIERKKRWKRPRFLWHSHWNWARRLGARIAWLARRAWWWMSRHDFSPAARDFAKDFNRWEAEWFVAQFHDLLKDQRRILARLCRRMEKKEENKYESGNSTE